MRTSRSVGAIHELPLHKSHDKKDLPKGWTWTTLGEISEVVGGGTPRTNDPTNFESGDIPWVTPADLSGYTAKKISHGSRYITEKGLSTSSARLMPAGTVLFTSRAPIGYVAIASNHIATNQGFKSFVLKEGILPDYVYWYLKGNKDLAESLASGTTFLELSGARAKQLPIPLAPIGQQEQIVAEIEKQFSRLDEAVAGLKRINANLKRYKAAILKAAVEGKLTEEWRKSNPNVETGAELLKRILAERKKKWKEKNPGKNYKEPVAPDTSNLPELPQGWTWSNIDAICSVSSGEAFKKKDYSDTGIRLFQIANVSFGEVIWDQKNYLPERFLQSYPDLELKENDIVLALNRPILNNKLKIARLTHQDVPAILYQRVAKFSFFEKSLSNYFFVFGQSPFFAKQVRINLQGTDQPYLNTSRIQNMIMPLPPLTEQRYIVTEVDRRLSLVRQIGEQVDANLKRAEHLRQSILKNAFSGQLISQTTKYYSEDLTELPMAAEATMPYGRRK